eukprot:GHVL01042955.1.p1 GENE.GHVL01042955.1~~GHVL01042955.1.p1  ORF type:complete len:752 (-),score=145.16 GHVL01042955.1:148-2403(-)
MVTPFALWLLEISFTPFISLLSFVNELIALINYSYDRFKDGFHHLFCYFSPFCANFYWKSFIRLQCFIYHIIQHTFYKIIDTTIYTFSFIFERIIPFIRILKSIWQSKTKSSDEYPSPKNSNITKYKNIETPRQLNPTSNLHVMLPMKKKPIGCELKNVSFIKENSIYGTSLLSSFIPNWNNEQVNSSNETVNSSNLNEMNFDRLNHWERRLEGAPITGDVTHLQPFTQWRSFFNPEELICPNVSSGYAQLRIKIDGFTSNKSRKLSVSSSVFDTIPDPYIKILYNGKKYFKSKVNIDGPTKLHFTDENISDYWRIRESFDFQAYHPLHLFALEVWDFDVMGFDQLIGSVVMPIWSLQPNRDYTGWAPVFNQTIVGYLKLVLHLQAPFSHSESTACSLPICSYHEISHRHPIPAKINRLFNIQFFSEQDKSYFSLIMERIFSYSLLYINSKNLLSKNTLLINAKHDNFYWPSVYSSLYPTPFWISTNEKIDTLSITSDEILPLGVIAESVNRLNYRLWIRGIKRGPILLEKLLLWQNRLDSFLVLMWMWLVCFFPRILFPSFCISMLIILIYHLIICKKHNENNNNILENNNNILENNNFQKTDCNQQYESLAITITNNTSDSVHEWIRLLSDILIYIEIYVDWWYNLFHWKNKKNGKSMFLAIILVISALIPYFYYTIICNQLSNIIKPTISLIIIFIRIFLFFLSNIIFMSATSFSDGLVRYYLGMRVMNRIRDYRKLYPMELLTSPIK